MNGNGSSCTFRVPGLPQSLNPIGFGGHPVGGHGWGKTLDWDSSLAAIRSAVEAGYNFFDTADVYGLGLSESLHGQMLKDFRDRRSEIVVATKGGVAWDSAGNTRRDSSRSHLLAAVDASLRRLDVEAIDLYFLHWPDGTTQLEESISALQAMKDQGKIRAIGVSNVPASGLMALLDPDIAAIQVKGNLLEPLDALDARKAARRLNASVITYSGLSDGLLTGSLGPDHRFRSDDHRSRYPLFQPGVYDEVINRITVVQDCASVLKRTAAQVSLRWMLDSGLADCVLVGSSNPSNVRLNAASAGWQLPTEWLVRLGEEVPLLPSDDLHSWLRSCLSATDSETCDCP